MHSILKNDIIIVEGEVYIMPTTKAQQRAVAKYMKENYDNFQLRMPKCKKDKIKAHAEQHGESLNGFINRVIDETIEKENKD